MPLPQPSPPVRSAMVLAAGRGERMRPLTDATPKPLLPVRGKPMIVWHLEALARAGIERVVVNCAWLEDQIPAALGDGSRWGLQIAYTMEGRDHGGALETAGGIAKALPLLDECFWLVSGDIFAPGFAFSAEAAARFLAQDRLAHLWLVPNPDFHPQGDFGLSPDGLGLDGPGPDGRRWTYANLALMRRDLCAQLPVGHKAALGPLLFAAMRARRVGAELYTGAWHNVGTPAQLRALDAGEHA
ncbi:N-acetylmuramate alpha-1-phosphate uridylyltransferase MurU [Pseudorhodoferax sp. Leaf267]|uniref:N-acetylmuramate alpha-1-phosphate uridylyltransferase MurU n=1 Tax=Pseudorhodoferax sp. Leaf267 TaxID=1736316 RepID=UPI0006F3F1B5|nr:nucleotidyltransferase family protein [Pseudorhodoferax sp. Leaf267]KQP21519.1 mannose-1-phosphate guanylyltransferase [Pseudorhodoferax sp. Leaf267]